MIILDKLKRRPNPSNKSSFYVGINDIIVPIDKSLTIPETPVPIEKQTAIIDETQIVAKPTKSGIKFTDMREHSTIDRGEILKRMQQQNLSVVKTASVPSKMPYSVEKEFDVPLTAEPVETGISLTTTPITTAQVESVVEIEQLPPASVLPKTSNKSTKRKIILNLDMPEQVDESEQAIVPELEPIIILKSKRPRTMKPNIAAITQFAQENLLERIPKASEKFIYRASSYYMNNRKLYIQKINQLFAPYKQQILENSDLVSCANRSESENFKMMIHQQIVRDYLNIYTPYRGLLLYHGLGAGKTCTSIAIAEGMKSDKKVILMTPASLKMNFFSELKKCGDLLYKKNQFWEFVSVDGKPEYVDILSSILSLPVDSVRKKHGAWMVDVNKPANFTNLSDTDQVAIDTQLNEMIRSKYVDINYNGINERKLTELTENYSINPFDNSVIIIDEAHNFMSRIVNKLRQSNSISFKLYDYLMKASNARIVLLSGTPIINYPNEIGILYNILRGYIKTWIFPLNVQTTLKINKDVFLDMFDAANFRTYDYVEYTGNNLIITRNPYGFINMRKPGPGKKTISGGADANMKIDTAKLHPEIAEEEMKQNEYFFDDPYASKNSPQYGGSAAFDRYNGVQLNESGNISDAQFVDIIKRILKGNNLSIYEDNIQIKNYKSLPDDPKEFSDTFIETNEQIKQMKNKSLFQRRILGLTSYYRSAQEQLLPRFVTDENENIYHLEVVDMSDYQFAIYENFRKDESEKDRSLGKLRKKLTVDEMFKISSTYKIYSRVACNFVFPSDVEKPIPDSLKILEQSEGIEDDNINEENVADESGVNQEVEIPVEYKERIKDALNALKSKSSEYFSPQGLQIYSPKFLRLLENILDKDNIGLHLIYSQFRTLEGIGLFKLVMEENGMAELKIKKNSETNQWEIVEDAANSGKPCFALYTGTETEEEREIIRNIYNGDWKYLPESILQKLRERSENNIYGEAIKVLMISSSGAEGINLKNTRYVHIMEPYWNMVRIQQVVGRARRICSHESLPDELRTVEVFIYLSSLSEAQRTSKTNKELILRDISRIDNVTPVTTDESLFELATLKDRIINNILKSVKESAIDCSLYSSKDTENLVCYGFGNVKTNSFSSYPSIEEDMGQKEETKQEKLKLSTVTIKDKKYAINKSNFELYNMDDYEDSVTTNKTIYPIGKLVKTQTGYLIEKI